MTNTNWSIELVNREFWGQWGLLFTVVLHFVQYKLKLKVISSSTAPHSQENMNKKVSLLKF